MHEGGACNTANEHTMVANDPVEFQIHLSMDHFAEKSYSVETRLGHHEDKRNVKFSTLKGDVVVTQLLACYHLKLALCCATWGSQTARISRIISRKSKRVLLVT